MLRGEDRVDLRAGTFEDRRQARYFGRDIVDRSRSSAFSTRSDAQVASASRFIAESSRCSLARSSRARSSWPSAMVFRRATLRLRSHSALDGAELLAESASMRRASPRARATGRVRARGREHARLLGQPRLQVGDAAADDLGFAGCVASWRSSWADTAAEVLHVAALLGEFLGGFLVRFLLAREIVLRYP